MLSSGAVVTRAAGSGPDWLRRSAWTKEAVHEAGAEAERGCDYAEAASN